MAADIRRAGPFANDAERRVVEGLSTWLAPGGVIITNLHLPDGYGTLEIDAVVINAYGVAAIETKGWNGRVHFGTQSCSRGGEQWPDPRPSISMKAKKLKGFIETQGRVAVRVVTNPFVVLAGRDVEIEGDVEEGVPVCTVEDLKAICKGELRSFTQSPWLSGAQMKQVADLLFARHDAKHRRQIGSYRLVERLDGDINEEYRGEEVSPPHHPVRLQRSVIDDLRSHSERAHALELAKRSSDALRKMQGARRRELPIVYSTFTDPNEDAAFWTAYEAVEGPTLLNAKLTLREKIAALAGVADALEACHRERIYHRALSTDCLVVPERQTTPRILHFDLARIESLPTIAKGAGQVRLRKIPHPAPEIERTPSNANAASDVYALGAVAAQVFTSTRLDADGDPRALARKIRPRELADVVLKMLEADAKKRLSMQAAADAFRRTRA